MLEKYANILKWAGTIISAVVATSLFLWSVALVFWDAYIEDVVEGKIEATVEAYISTNTSTMAESYLRGLSSLKIEDYENLPIADRPPGNLVEFMTHAANFRDLRERVDSVYNFSLFRVYPDLEDSRDPDFKAKPISSPPQRIIFSKGDRVKLFSFVNNRSPNGRRGLESGDGVAFLQLDNLRKHRFQLSRLSEGRDITCSIREIFARFRPGSDHLDLFINLYVDDAESIEQEYHYDVFVVTSKEPYDDAQC